MTVQPEGPRYVRVARAALAATQILVDTPDDTGPTLAAPEALLAVDGHDDWEPRASGAEQDYLVRARAALAAVEIQERAVGTIQPPAPAVSSEAACDPECGRHEDVVTQVDTRSTGDGTTTGNPTATTMVVQTGEQPSGRTDGEKSELSEKSPSIPAHARTVSTVVADLVISATASSVIVAGTEAVDPTVRITVVQANEQPGGRSKSERSEESEESPSLPVDDQAVTAAVADPVIRVVASSVILGGAGVTRPNIAMIESLSDLAAALPDLLGAPSIGLDIETSGSDSSACLDPRRGRIRLVQLATPARVYLVDCIRLDIRALAPVFEHGHRIVGHNLRFDLAFLAANGLSIPDGRRLFDTMLADQVLDGGRHAEAKHRGWFSLASVAQRRLGVTLSKEQQQSDWGVAELSTEQITYAAADAAVLLPLADTLDAALRDADLVGVAQIEMRCLPGLVWLQGSGVLLDAERWSALTEAAVQIRDRLRTELEDLVGRPLNPNSHKQVLQALSELGIKIQTTNAEALATVVERHPFVAKLLAYREAAKLAGTYGANILAHVHPVTGRVHADLIQIGAASGRMACSRPNLQNIPRTPAYRACFRAPDGRALVKVDYSQIELRIAAEITGDQRMLEAYRRGEDLHAVTAASVLEKPIESVSREDRQLAKALNFGLLYGMGEATLQRYALVNYDVHLEPSEAHQFRERFFTSYTGIRRWHRAQPDGRLDTRTVAGRLRLGVTRFTEKLNTPVQGTGADGLKAALALLCETRHRHPSAVPVLLVHDEIVAECDADEAEAVRDWLVDCMKGGMGAFLTRVPVEVEATICLDWAGTPLPGPEGAEEVFE